MKTTYKLPPFIASLIAHCYDSARATQQYAREIVADKQTPEAVKFAFIDVAASFRSPIERIERGIPSVKQQEFKEHIVDADPLIFQNIQYLYSRMTKEKKELLEQFAEELLQGKVRAIAPESRNDGETYENIISFISKAKNISNSRLTSKARHRDVTICRQLCIYVGKQKTNLPLKALGARFGGRDHTTVIHSIKTIKDLMCTDSNIKRDVEYFMGFEYNGREEWLQKAS